MPETDAHKAEEAIVVLVVILGNAALQCNCFASGLDAAMALPWITEIENHNFYVRIGICLVYSILVPGLLILDHFNDSYLMSYFLGMVRLPRETLKPHEEGLGRAVCILRHTLRDNDRDIDSDIGREPVCAQLVLVYHLASNDNEKDQYACIHAANIMGNVTGGMPEKTFSSADPLDDCDNITKQTNPHYTFFRDAATF